MNRDLKELLINENISKIITILDSNYKKNIETLFKAFSQILNNYSLEDIDNSLSSIEDIVILENDVDKLKQITILINKIFKTLETDKLNKEALYKHIKFRLINIKKEISKKIDNQHEDSLYKFFEYLVFEEKNINLIKSLFKREKDFFETLDEDGNSLFSNLLNYFANLKDKEEIKYYYEVIDLYLKEKDYEFLSQDKENYLDILDKPYYRNKDHVSRLIKVINKVEEESLEKRYGIITSVNPLINKELKDMRPNNHHKQNYLDQACITIDGKEAMCLDDALYLRRNKNSTFTLFVHITNIPSLIDFSSALMNNAFKKFETIYLPDKNINLFPNEISNDLASLLPNVKRNVISYIVDFDQNYNLLPDTFRIERGRISVKNRLTYDMADDILKEDSDDKLNTMLYDLLMLSLKLKKSNPHKEKYRNIENKFDDKETNVSRLIYKYKSANIIQETMVLVNHLAPIYFKKLSIPYLYRNHIIDEDKINEILSFIDFNNLNIMDETYRKYYNIIKESYLTAYYSSSNKGHYGLGFTDGYSHSTSPARRASDCLNQFLTIDIYFNSNNDDKNLYYWENLIEEYAKDFNKQAKLNELYLSKYCYMKAKTLIKK